MSKNLIRRGTEEEAADVLALLGRMSSTYAINMLQLQEKVGLTYKEARAFLIPYRENAHAMAHALDIDIHSVYNLQRKAKKKIKDSGYSLEEIFEDHMPVSPGPIFVSYHTDK
ncbi:MAG: hypothetical protein FWH44_01110 [Methanomassiliicoccaceae archaeon]|nr:hypothetical protein [Methanomassiliicoccaceae archaeon]